MTQRLGTLGFKADDMEGLGFSKEQLFGSQQQAPPAAQGSTKEYGGVTYVVQDGHWVPQVGMDKNG